MAFENKNTKYTADAPSFTASISMGASGYWTATIAYKAGWKAGPPSVTAKDSDSLMVALTKQDSGCKFYRTSQDTAASRDAAVLERMRTDPSVKDVEYFRACRSFNVKPQVRNLSTANTSAPQAVKAAPSLVESILGWGEFEREHAEILRGPFAILNLRIIEQWFADEPGAQWTAANLATCYAELNALQCFRTAQTLTRGLNGDLKVVHPYSRARVLALRNQQVTTQQNTAPSNLSEADTAAWNAVRAKYPQLPVNSAGFKQLCANTVLAWAKENVLENQPELAATNKRGELSVAINRVLVAWTKNKNLGVGNKTIRDTRIWLG